MAESKDFSHFGNPFHWYSPGDDESCWWFVQVEYGLILRMGPTEDPVVDTLRDEADGSYWIVENSDSKWHRLADCPNTRGDSR